MKFVAILITFVLNSLFAVSQQQVWQRVPDSAFVDPKFGRYFFRYHDYADDRHAMATVWDGSPSQRVAVLKTTDGGDHWFEAYSDSASGSPQIVPLTNVSYPDTDAVFVGGYHGYLIRSADGGRTWSRKLIASRNGQFGSAIGKVHMFDAANGAFIPDVLSDVIAITTDGWNSWDSIPLHYIPLCSDSSVRLFADEICCIGKGNVLATILEDTRKYVVQTTDAGMTWSYAIGIDYAEPLSTLQTGRFSFSDGVHGWYMYTSHTDSTNSFVHSVFRTKPYGRTWERVFHGAVLDSVNDRMICISARDSSNAIIGGATCIYRTSDGGQTWERDSIANQQSGSLTSAAVTQKQGTTGFANDLMGIYRTVKNAVSVRVSNPGRSNQLVTPNPSSTHVVVHTLTDRPVSQVVVINILGEVVLPQYDVAAGRIVITISTLSNGVYRACIKHVDGRLDFIPIVIQR